MNINMNDFTEALQLLTDLVNVEELQQGQGRLEPETQLILNQAVAFLERHIDAEDCTYCSYEGCACQD